MISRSNKFLKFLNSFSLSSIIFLSIFNFQTSIHANDNPKSDDKNPPKTEIVFRCQGLTGIVCPQGYYCKINKLVLDELGVCVKIPDK